MTDTILVAGTASHVGKSTLTTGLCRLLADRGYDVAPFKAQNMSTNARVVLVGPTTGDSPTGSGDPEPTSAPTVAADRPTPQWGEIGVSQFVQAKAARTTPTTDANPVLLKPRGDGESQLVVDGQPAGHVRSDAYYEAHWENARAAALDAHRRLARTADVIVAEGAGSIAEINLHDRDLANVETARFADASIVICVDIERGGAFASLYGTLALLPDDVRDRVVGAAITKFRGDPSLLTPGIRTIEARCGVPILGVVPYEDFDLPAEDSLGLPDSSTGERRGADDGVPEADSVTVGVPRLPHLSNAADVEALVDVPGVRVEYVPITAANRDRLAAADGIVLPGTKNAVDDCLELRRAGFGDVVRSFDGPIVGICGGYQVLGRRLLGAHHEGTGDASTLDGLGVLPVETRFAPDKRVCRRRVTVDGCGPIAGATGEATGYEIHAGTTTVLEPVPEPVEPGSAVCESVLGTYLHGLFANPSIRSAFVDAVYRGVDGERPRSDRSTGGTTDDAIDRVATVVDRSLTLSPILGELAPPG
ncbi:cobyric acid synthase [Halovivax cerinus]|uniref:Probable cobyric acid synthase n=1 Tax=Halovivax cerinus TaxID=1487865 RepID=A0ABD5NMJ9_9EURY|nr:cobyric acid synthase [Halovivax cerinus]